MLGPDHALMRGRCILTNPADNIRAGVQHLKRLLSRHRTVKNAIAAYNAGSHTVRRHGGIPPYPETRQYVTTTFVLQRIYE